jgi:arabinose-5-phosphate isomerase
MSDAVTLMAQRKISELPVVDADGRPAGLIDVTDVVGLLPREEPPGAVCPELPPPSGCRLFPGPESA